MKYVLITPARNEELYIEKTIISVINQTVLPLRWIIVSDGSTDRTEEIVEKYIPDHSFIELIKLPFRNERHFAGKVNAIKEGFKSLANLSYDYYGNLDADVSFNKDYFEVLLNKFINDPSLGICGGRLYDKINDRFVELRYSLESVAGPIQFFRRKCYEEIGGYVESKSGLVDAIAEVTARMKGWKTYTFKSLKVHHHRKTGSEGKNIWRAVIREGYTDYLFGVHLLWNLLRSFQRINKSPIIIGSFLRMFGYWTYKARRVKRPVSKEFVKFLRDEEKLKFKIYFPKRNYHEK
jgi:glycosyltransferase involved in cell wall biosynthesis